MNDKDKESFNKWHYQNISNPPTLNDLIQKAWSDACEYKQKEIDEIKNVTYWTVEQDGKVTRHISISEIEKLQAENAKLRKCVEFYSVNGLSKATVGTKIDTKLTHQFYINGEYARQVLKELEGK